MFTLRGYGLGDLGIRVRGGGQEFEVDPAGGWTPLPEGPPGWNRWGIDFVRQEWAKAYAARVQATMAAIAARPELKACDALGQWVALCNIERSDGNVNILKPLGTIVELGVAFLPSELAQGFLEKTYAPAADQRFMADYAIYTASQNVVWAMANFLRTARAVAIKPGVDGSKPFNAGVDEAELLKTIGRVSITLRAFMERFGFITSVPGFSLNPIEPTLEELDGKGGLEAYYKRGGFLIAQACITGQQPIASATISWNTGYCRCGWGVRATYDKATGEGFGWIILLTLINNQYKIRIQPKDAPWWSETTTFMAGAMKELARFMCANRTLAQQFNTSTLGAELCQDASGKPCTKGAKGCYCAPPTNMQQAAIGVANVGLNKWCEYVDPWLNPTPKTPFEPPPALNPPATPPPWWLIALGGLVAGGVIAFSRK